MPKEVKKRGRQNRESKKFLTDSEQSEGGEIKSLIIQKAEQLGIEPTLAKKFSNVWDGFVRDFVHDEMISVLFLAADPTDTCRLRLGEELREIQEKLQLAKLRERFQLHQRMSVRPEDISQALLDIQPQIVHFSGHGTGSGALCFENQVGGTHPIESEALAALFEQFTNQVNCIILNACYSEIQANAISKRIKYVIGMNQATWR